MKNHLKKAVTSYEKINKQSSINPISNTDAEIIVELLEALKKIGKTDLVAILDGWKYKKDEDVRDDLLTWNTEYNSEVNQEEDVKYTKAYPGLFGGYYINSVLYEKKDTRYFIEIKGAKYEIEHIFNYSKIQEWDYERPVGNKYGIKLNEHPDDVKKQSLYADKKIFYNSIEERDKEFDKLDKVFCSFDNIRIID